MNKEPNDITPIDFKTVDDLVEYYIDWFGQRKLTYYPDIINFILDTHATFLTDILNSKSNVDSKYDLMFIHLASKKKYRYQELLNVYKFRKVG